MTKVTKKLELYETNDVKSIFSQCDKTKKHCLMTGLTANTGMGKTTTLTAYAANECVYMVTVEKTMNAKQFFLSIAKVLELECYGTIYDVVNRISSCINELDNVLLIIDEASKLNHTMLLYLHDLREKTKFNCGILLAGMPYFKTRLINFSEKQKEGCSEFFRRVNLWHELGGLSRKETEYICSQHHIEPVGCYGLRFGDLMNKILLEQVITNTL